MTSRRTAKKKQAQAAANAVYMTLRDDVDPQLLAVYGIEDHLRGRAGLVKKHLFNVGSIEILFTDDTDENTGFTPVHNLLVPLDWLHQPVPTN